MSAIRIGFLAVLAAVLFFHRLGDRDLWNSHEARAGQNAQGILDTGDWALPRLYDGRAELQKPPLYYWLVAGVGWLQGGVVDAWAVRLPAALAAMGCVLAVFGAAARQGRPVAGLVAATVLATALHFTWLARVGRVDMPLTFAITVTLCGVWLRMPLTVYLALATAVLLKGPIGIVLPLAVVMAAMARAKAQRRKEEAQDRPRLLCAFAPLRELFAASWWGVPLLLAFSIPWFVYANWRTDGELFRVFFWKHNIARGFDEAGGLRAHPWWFYGPQFALDFLPWTPLLLAAVLRGRWRDDRLARFGLTWFGVMFLLLSLVRYKRADYLLPAYPGAALFLGCVAETWYRTAVRPHLLASGFAAVVAGCVAGWLVYVNVVLPADEPPRDATRFAAAVRSRVGEAGPLCFFRTEAHALAFHLRRPLTVLVEWQDLERWAARTPDGFVVMPRAVAEESTRHLPQTRLDEVLDNCQLAGGRHEKPLVLLRTRPPEIENSDARTATTAADRDRTAEPAAGGRRRAGPPS